MTDIEIIKTCGWNIQSEKDIWDSFNDWSLHRFVCIMKNNNICTFSGILDETYDGHINKHIDCVENDDLSIDDIAYWIEAPINVKK